MQLDFRAIMALDTYYRATLINKLSGPKSGNLIGTTSNSGTTNLAIFNSVIHIGANPPYLGFLLRPLTVERHTYNNIKETGQFTINQLHMGIHQAGHQTSAKYPESVSEFEACGFTEEYVGDFRAPFVKESRVKLGLTFVEEQLIKTNDTVLIIGRVDHLILPEDCLAADGDLDFERLETVVVGGLDTYYSCHKLGRYDRAKPDKELKELN